MRKISWLLIANVLLMNFSANTQVAEARDKSVTNTTNELPTIPSTNSKTIMYATSSNRYSASGKMQSNSWLSINICTSRTCGLVYFVETIAGRPHTTGELRTWYLTQRGINSKQDLEICDRYSKFLNQVGDKYDAPDSIGRQMTLSQRIACMTIDCQTLNELLDKLKPILSAEDLTVVADAYRHFEPIYESLLWKPRYNRLMQQLEDFREGVKRTELIARLEQVRRFMKSNWPENTPLDTIVIPLPDEPKSSHADSVGKTQIVEIIAEDMFADQSDTLFHELCHSLWELADQRKVQKDFERFDGAVAYLELNEALATALGQGWFRNVAYPNAEPSPLWYGREVTENYGRGLYPLVDKYLREGRCFDAAFAKKATQIFAQKCPRVETEVCNTYAVHVTSEHAPDYSKLQDAMFAAMPTIRSTDWESLSVANLSRKVKSPAGKPRRIVLLAPDAIDTLTAHGLTAQQVMLLKQRATDCICITVGGSEIIFCIGKDIEAQTEVFLKLLKAEKYPSPSHL